MFPLGLLNKGETGEVIKINKSLLADNPGSYEDAYFRLEELGIRIGRSIEMLNSSHENSLLIKVDNSRLALPRKMAMKIFVRKI